MAEERISVAVRPPAACDAEEFVAAVQRSRPLHEPWIEPPATAEAYADWLARLAARTPHRRHAGFLASADGQLAGYIAVSEIVLGAFRSAYLAYAAFVPWAGRGIMRRALHEVVDTAFGPEPDGGLGLHRLEANIQPANLPSKALVTSLGFRLEGLSPRYLRIAGEWRDHERYALTTEEWPPRR